MTKTMSDIPLTLGLRMLNLDITKVDWTTDRNTAYICSHTFAIGRIISWERPVISRGRHS